MSMNDKPKVISNQAVEFHTFNNWENYKIVGDKVEGKVCAMLKDGAWVSPIDVKSPSGYENKGNKVVNIFFTANVEYTFDPTTKNLNHFEIQVNKKRFQHIKTGEYNLTPFDANADTEKNLLAVLASSVKESIEVAYCWI